MAKKISSGLNKGSARKTVGNSSKKLPRPAAWTGYLICVFLLAGFPNAANAMYKCVDANGTTSFQDSPCRTSAHDPSNSPADEVRSPAPTPVQKYEQPREIPPAAQPDVTVPRAIEIESNRQYKCKHPNDSSTLYLSDIPCAPGMIDVSSLEQSPPTTTSPAPELSAKMEQVSPKGETETDNRSESAPAPHSNRMEKIESFLSAIAILILVYIWFRWAFAVAGRAKREGRSAVGWFITAYLVTPMFASIMLISSHGLDTYPDRWRASRWLSILGFLVVAIGLAGAWNNFQDNKAFQQFGQEGVIEPVEQYSLDKSRLILIDAYFNIQDGKQIKVARIIPQTYASKLIHGESVKITYLSNEPEKVRFENESPKPSQDLIFSGIALIISFVFWLRSLSK